jgi:L-2-hydroxyglutarate oxidase LhgO
MFHGKAMTDTTDTLVIGAGVIGLAVARALAMAGRDVIVIEKNAHIGEETSSRSSEVIHAGLYYPTGSLKATLCVAGKAALYAYCADKGIPHRRCGKVLVATSQTQLEQLRAVERQAAINGVTDLEWLDERGVHALEPDVEAVAGLFSPSTGILDSHALMVALQGDLERHDGMLALKSAFVDGAVGNRRLRVTIDSDGTRSTILARTLVNCAGLHASRVANALRGLDPRLVPATRFAKGHYFNLRGPSPFRHLVYPLPEQAGLGVHATLDLAGRTRFGPDVEWSDTLDYSINESRAAAFYAAVRRYWPALADDTLEPGHVGVRPKITGPGEKSADFLIQGPDDHGIEGLVNLFGIESPGLTACLAIADHVAGLLEHGNGS